MLLSGPILAILLAGCADRTPYLGDRTPTPTVQWSESDLHTLPVRMRDWDIVNTSGSFTDARAVALDARGRIYVSDAGLNVVWYADPAPGDSLDWQTLGGPGSTRGQFLSPDGLDVDAGSILGVADSGNGRIQRFTRGGAVMEIIPVGLELPTDPVRLQSLSDGTLFVLTRTAPFLFRMDRERERVQPVFLNSAEQDDKPIDMARLDRGVVILDERGTLHVLNNAGITIRRVEGLPLSAIDPMAGGLLGVTDNAIIVFDAWPKPLERWSLSTVRDVRGVAVRRDTVHVISGTHLHRLP